MTTQSNIVADVATLTRVPNKVLVELIKKCELCIGSAIHDALLAKQDATVINIGIGTLSVELNTMQCKFIPSKELKTVIKRCITEEIDPVEFILEKTLVDKLVAMCGEAI